MPQESDETHHSQTTCSRRRVLRAGGSALAAGVAGSSAGCLSLLPPVGQQVRYGRVDVPAPTNSEPTYRRWLPAASELTDLGDVDLEEGINWTYVTPGNLGNTQLGGEFRIGIDIVQTGLSYFGEPLGAYDNLVGIGGLGTVVESPIDTDQVTATLLDSGYQRAGTYRGYELFDRSDLPRTVAISGEAIVQTRGDQRHAKAHTVIDTGDGHSKRQHEADESFAQFSDWVGSYPTVMEGFPPSLTDTTAKHRAMAYTFDEQAGYFSSMNQYRAGETPARRAIKQGLEENLSRATAAWSVDIEIDDPQVAVQMRIEKEQFGSDFTESTLPYVTWGVKEDQERVTISHEAGKPVSVQKLDIDPAAALRSRPDGTLEAGDTLIFDRDEFSADESIRIVYEFSTDGSALLFSYEPDANDTTT